MLLSTFPVIMETVGTSALCTSKSEAISSELLYTNERDINEISKEKEEELLYGTGDDGDEEDTLSDDSLRLRLSDDDDDTETDRDDIGANGVINNRRFNSQIEKMDLQSDTQIAPTLEQETPPYQQTSAIEKKPIESESLKQEEQMSGNFSVDDRTMSERHVSGIDEKDTNRSGCGQWIITYNSPSIRPMYKGQWGFSNFSRSRPFHNRASYPRHNYRNDDQYYQNNINFSSDSNSYKNRYYNNFSHYGRGRGNTRGNYNPYFREHYKRDNKKHSRTKYRTKSFPYLKSLDTVQDNKQSLFNEVQVPRVETSKNVLNESHDIKATPSNTIVHNEIRIKTTSKSINEEEGHDDSHDASENCNTSYNHKLEIKPNDLIDINTDSHSECTSEMSNSYTNNEVINDQSNEENYMTENWDISRVKQCSETYDDDTEKFTLNEDEDDIGNIDPDNVDLHNESIALVVKKELIDMQDDSSDKIIGTDEAIEDFNSSVKHEQEISIQNQYFDDNTVKSENNYETEINNVQEQLQDIENKYDVKHFDICDLDKVEETEKIEITSDDVTDVVDQESTLDIDVCEKSKDMDREEQSNEIVTLQSEYQSNDYDENNKNIESKNEEMYMQVSCDEQKITPYTGEKNINEIEHLTETCSNEKKVIDLNDISKEEHKLDNVDSIINESDQSANRNNDVEDSPINLETQSNEQLENSENYVVINSDEKNQQETEEMNGEDHSSACKQKNAEETVENNTCENTSENDLLYEGSKELDTTPSTEDVLHSVHDNDIDNDDEVIYLENDRSSSVDNNVKVELSQQSGGLVSECIDSVVAQSKTLPVNESGKNTNKRKPNLTMSKYELLLSKDSSDEYNDNEKGDQKDVLQEKMSDVTESMINETNEIVQTDNTASIEKMNNAENVKDTRSTTVIKNSDVNEHLVSTDVTTSTVESETAKLSADERNINSDSDTENTSSPVIGKRKRPLKRSSIEIEDSEEETENVKQKRRTTIDLEKVTTDKLAIDDINLESNENSECSITSESRSNGDTCSVSSLTLKRNSVDTEPIIPHTDSKKVRRSPELQKSTEKNESDQENQKSITSLSYIQKLFRRDAKEKLAKLTQDELEELLIQKIVETITMRGEIGRLREQARICEKNQEATRFRCQQLTKQVKDFEMVLTRNAADRRANNEKPVAPIKINRSVGLQVNFMSEHGMQNLKQVQQNTLSKTVTIVNTYTPTNESVGNIANNARRGIKTRSPRKPDVPVTTSVIPTTPTQVQSQSQVTSATPAALVIAKPVESLHTLTLPNQTNSVQQLLPKVNTQHTPVQQTVVLNGKVSNQPNRQASLLNVSNAKKTNDLIDLTDEEDKVKSVITTTTVATTTIATVTSTNASKQQSRYQRVIQAIPGNVTLAAQPAIRVVQPASQPTPTALVNNMSTSRLTYVVQNGPGTRQLLVTSNPNQIRPGTPNTRTQFPTLTYKTGISTLANGTVRMLTTSANSNPQMGKHPAPLPDSPTYTTNSILKFPPPAPSLKISKVAHGIVLSWNMSLSDKYAEIASYQLYAYQEINGIPPNTTLWKKVGDVRALPLPMACTLTQFSEGNNYHFAVRAVDTHSRLGKYSAPGNISL